MFEIFFDLVFVFAITRVVSFMEHAPDRVSALEGLLLLILLWWAWCAFIWLGNQVRLDTGYIQIGMLIAMGGLFVAALVIPQAWTPGSGRASPALILALAFIVVRVSYVAMFVAVSREDQNLRTQLILDVIPQSASSTLLVLGAVLGGTHQTVLWACAFGADFGGGRLASRYSGWRLGSPGHFVERHGLVVIIALGETLVSAGTGTGDAVSGTPAVVAALLCFVIAVSLWQLYFGQLSTAAEHALSEVPVPRRPALARDGYTFGHFPLIAGVVYVALGIKLMLDEVVLGTPGPNTVTATWALCGGVALYLAGLEAFRYIALRVWRRTPLIAAAALLLLPAATGGQAPLVSLSLVAAVIATVALASARASRG